MERGKFTRELKLEAVRLMSDRGVSFTQASVELGVHVSRLRSWVKRYAEDPQYAFPSSGKPRVGQINWGVHRKYRVFSMLALNFQIAAKSQC